MGKVITMINEKGGIGKTSCAFHTAWELAKTKRVLLIDMDGQEADLTFFCGFPHDNNAVTISDVLQKGTPIGSAIRNVKEGLDLIPANTMVTTLDPHGAKIRSFRQAVQSVSGNYDYIFIDVNPAPNWNHVLALSVCDACVILMIPDITSLQSNLGITESIQEIQETTNNRLKVAGILLNNNEVITNLGKSVRGIAEKNAEQLGTKVFATKIRHTVKLGESVQFHQGITDYAPNEPVAQDFRDFIGELERSVNDNGEV